MMTSSSNRVRHYHVFFDERMDSTTDNLLNDCINNGARRSRLSKSENSGLFETSTHTLTLRDTAGPHRTCLGRA